MVEAENNYSKNVEVKTKVFKLLKVSSSGTVAFALKDFPKWKNAYSLSMSLKWTLGIYTAFHSFVSPPVLTVICRKALKI